MLEAFTIYHYVVSFITSKLKSPATDYLRCPFWLVTSPFSSRPLLVTSKFFWVIRSHHFGGHHEKRCKIPLLEPFRLHKNPCPLAKFISCAWEIQCLAPTGSPSKDRTMESPVLQGHPHHSMARQRKLSSAKTSEWTLPPSERATIRW